MSTADIKKILVTTDLSDEALKAYPLVRSLTKAYGALTSYPQYKLYNISRRDTFIIDPEGRIARRYENVNAEGHSKMVLAELAKLQK